MNLFIHQVEDDKILREDTLNKPLFVDGRGKLDQFDVVLANPPFSLKDWGSEKWAADPHKRAVGGVPPKSNGDFAWVNSGLNVTKAQYWMYLKVSEEGDFRSALSLPTARLNAYRQWYKSEIGTSILPSGSRGSGYMIGNINGQVPTLGLRIVASDIPLLQYSPLFDGKASQ
jgi:hypothetical protein